MDGESRRDLIAGPQRLVYVVRARDQVLPHRAEMVDQSLPVERDAVGDLLDVGRVVPIDDRCGVIVRDDFPGERFEEIRHELASA
jgi:hypothetical protein